MDYNLFEIKAFSNHAPGASLRGMVAVDGDVDLSPPVMPTCATLTPHPL